MLMPAAGNVELGKAQAELGDGQEVDAQVMETPLVTAARNGCIEVVKALIKADANVNTQHNNGFSALFIACKVGHYDVVQELLRASANVNQQSPRRETSPLWIAAQNGHGEIVQELIAAKADVDAQQTDGLSPAYIAQNGHHEVVQVLINANADIDLQEYGGASPLYIASYNGHSKVVQALINSTADVDLQESRHGLSPLYAASQNGHLQVVQLLLKSQTDVDLQSMFGASPLYIAAENGHRQVVQALICANADVNSQECEECCPLYVAAQNGHQRVVEALISTTVNVDLQRDNGSSPLFVASQFGHHGIVEALIDTNADVDLQDDEDCSPVYIAAQNGHWKVVKALIKANANLNLRSDDDISPLEAASYNGHFEVFQLLIKAGAKHSADNTEFLLLLRHLAFCGKSSELLLALTTSPVTAEDFRSMFSSACVSLIHDCLQLASVSESNPYVCRVSDCDFSLQLHSTLLQSGFSSTRATLQSAAADVLQHIIRKKAGGQPQIFVVGSFSEGWGNSLVTMNGVTDPDSDIDVTEFYSARLLHLRTKCTCKDADADDTVDYFNGHVEYSAAETPADNMSGNSLKPAVDHVKVYCCCCYPDIEVLRHDAKTHIPHSLIQSLKQVVNSFECHLATAGPPGRQGQFLRVSTTFLERTLLRSLNTIQGQVFILLKYIIKKVISAEVDGLKTYHAKTLVFYMLDETPQEEWQARNLVSLVRLALHKLLHFLSNAKAKPNECMKHFFMRDAIIYLKKTNDTDAKTNIFQAVSATVEKLPEILMKFEKTLKPLNEGKTFYFHPFLILPYQFSHSGVRKEVGVNAQNFALKYDEIYDVVESVVKQLLKDDATLEQMTARIVQIPDCARTARETLRAMALLKLGMQDDAKKVLHDTVGYSVCRGMCPDGMTSEEVSEEMIWQHLKNNDSAFKFFLYNEFLDEQCLHFLPGQMARFFPTQMTDVNTRFFLFNFDAAQKCLCMELLDDEVAETTKASWFESVVQSGYADVQEMQMVLQYCTDVDQLTRLIHSHRRTVEEERQVKDVLDVIIDCWPDVREAACVKTFTDVKLRLLHTRAQALHDRDAESGTGSPSPACDCSSPSARSASDSASLSN